MSLWFTSKWILKGFTGAYDIKLLQAYVVVVNDKQVWVQSALAKICTVRKARACFRSQTPFQFFTVCWDSKTRATKKSFWQKRRASIFIFHCMSLFSATGVEATRRRQNKIIRIPTRVEPKVFFANERTFLHHAHYSLIITLLGLLLLNTSSSLSWNNYSVWLSVAFVVVGLSWLVRQLKLFLWRSDRIRNRDVNEYMDWKGPTYLVLALGCAILANILVRVL